MKFLCVNIRRIEIMSTNTHIYLVIKYSAISVQIERHGSRKKNAAICLQIEQHGERLTHAFRKKIKW